MKRGLEAMGNLDHQMIDVKLENIQTGIDFKHQGAQKTCKLYILSKYFVDADAALVVTYQFKKRFKIIYLLLTEVSYYLQLFHIVHSFLQRSQHVHQNRIFCSNSMPPFSVYLTSQTNHWNQVMTNLVFCICHGQCFNVVRTM